ncbi:ATPase, T2SS/T4P/T4SS family [Paenibacillus polymyxa]|uniref:ATPase, T2SS/T4P/T4SS family n=1 Tax=Paenibacillus polymyxa TaxID=1406 RepID=UPI0025B6C8FA|nr:ATPase, T2SS/T4P/T4SS family [Paenibacillus polymyxa]MDN4090902.1 hypothetical protein [Paenibacillus polymyxa]
MEKGRYTEARRNVMIEDSEELMLKNDQYIEMVHVLKKSHHLLRPKGNLIIGEIRDPETAKIALASMNTDGGFQFTVRKK